MRDEDDYLQVLEEDLEAEDNPENDQKSSFAKTGKQIMNKWIDKMKPNESAVSFRYNSEDCYINEDEDFSLRSDTIYEGIEENKEIIKTREILDNLCRDKMYMLGEKPELQVMVATMEEHNNIPNVRDEVVEGNENAGSRKGSSIFPIPEQVKVNEEWRYKYELEDVTYTIKEPFGNPEELITSSWTGMDFIIRPMSEAEKSTTPANIIFFIAIMDNIESLNFLEVVHVKKWQEDVGIRSEDLIYILIRRVKDLKEGWKPDYKNPRIMQFFIRWALKWLVDPIANPRTSQK